jgi:hypothetical protein
MVEGERQQRPTLNVPVFTGVPESFEQGELGKHWAGPRLAKQSEARLDQPLVRVRRR